MGLEKLLGCAARWMLCGVAALSFGDTAYGQSQEKKEVPKSALCAEASKYPYFVPMGDALEFEVDNYVRVQDILLCSENPLDEEQIKVYDSDKNEIKNFYVKKREGDELPWKYDILEDKKLGKKWKAGEHYKISIVGLSADKKIVRLDVSLMPSGIPEKKEKGVVIAASQDEGNYDYEERSHFSGGIRDILVQKSFNAGAHIGGAIALGKRFSLLADVNASAHSKIEEDESASQWVHFEADAGVSYALSKKMPLFAEALAGVDYGNLFYNSAGILIGKFALGITGEVIKDILYFDVKNTSLLVASHTEADTKKQPVLLAHRTEGELAYFPLISYPTRTKAGPTIGFESYWFNVEPFVNPYHSDPIDKRVMAFANAGGIFIWDVFGIPFEFTLKWIIPAYPSRAYTPDFYAGIAYPGMYNQWGNNKNVLPKADNAIGNVSDAGRPPKNMSLDVNAKNISGFTKRNAEKSVDRSPKQDVTELTKACGDSLSYDAHISACLLTAKNFGSDKEIINVCGNAASYDQGVIYCMGVASKLNRNYAVAIINACGNESQYDGGLVSCMRAAAALDASNAVKVITVCGESTLYDPHMVKCISDSAE